MKTMGKLSGESVTFNTARHLYIILFVAVAIIVLRRPDAIFNPQFWAEDGTKFYADAYNKGIIIPLLSPQGGYLDTLPRIIAAFSQLFPLSWAPLLFTMSVIMLKGILVCFLLSTRFSHVIPAIGPRLLLSFLYLALPNSWEVNASLASAKIHLAVLAFMVLSAGPGGILLWHFFDAGILLLSCLSGPFCIMLTPIATLFCFLRRDKRSFIFLVLIGICALIQGAFLVMDNARPSTILGATPELSYKILSVQVFLGALIGQRGLHFILHLSGFYNVIVTVSGILGLAAVINALLRAPMELRLFILFAFLLFSAALFSPLINRTDPQWPLMLIPGVGGRYWFIPMLAFTSVLIWSLRWSSSRIPKMLAALAFVVMMAGIIMDWRYPAFTDFHFKEQAYQFESAPIGAQVTIPINPPVRWMTLIKH